MNGHSPTSRFTPALPTEHRGAALTVLLVPASLTLLSVTSVNVALPAIREDLATGAISQALILTSYAFVFALLLLPAGLWGDRYGHKRVFVIGTVLFGLGSLWAGVAPDAVQVILGRAMTGVGGALAVTPLTALIQLMYAGPERARPFGIMGAVMSASSAAGPLLGGVLIQSGGDLGWRMVFLVNVPIALIAALVAAKIIPTTPPAQARRADLVGLTLFTAGLACAMLPFSLGTGVTAANGVLLIVGVGLLVGFGAWVRHRDAHNRPSAVPAGLFRQRAMPIGFVTTFLGFAGFTAAFLMLALLWQEGLGRSALAAGLVVLPFATGSTVSAIASNSLTAKMGAHIVTVGLAMIAGGLATVAVMILLLPPEQVTILLVTVPLFITGLGAGMFVGPNTNASLAQTSTQDAGVGSAMVTVAQRAGTAMGIGMLSAWYVAMPDSGPDAMQTHAIAAFGTALLPAVAAVVMVATKRAQLQTDSI